MDDVLIIGGSAASTAAAIYLARRHAKLRVVSYDWGGEVARSGEIGNYPGFVATDGIELSEKFLEHIRSYEVEPELEIKITSLKKEAEGHFVAGGVKNGEKVRYEAKAVIVSTGSHPRELGVPGEKEFRGKGLTYCTVCDGPLYKGKVVATIGGGDSANESGIMMNDIASKAYVLTKNPAMKGDPSLISRLRASKNVTIIPSASTTQILGEKFVTGLEYEDVLTKEKKTLEVQGVFVHIGMIPNVDFLPNAVEKNQFGEVVVDKNTMQSSMPGLFAAGDVTDMPFKQVGISIGQGTVAALAAVTYINKLEA